MQKVGSIYGAATVVTRENFFKDTTDIQMSAWEI